MRTSTLLVVLAALVLLVACVAPVYADDVAVSSSSSSSTGSDSSSSSSAPSTSSSAASTASFSSSTVPTGNGTSTTSSGSGTTPVTPTINPTQSIVISFPVDIATNNTADVTQFKSTVASAVTQSLQQATSNGFTGNVTVTSVAAGSTVATVQVTNPPSTSAQGLADLIAANRVGYLDTATIGGNAPAPSAASSISIGFAAVAVVLAALLQ